MNRKILTYKSIFVLIATYIVAFGVIFMVAGPQIKYRPLTIESAELGGVIGGVYEGRIIEQEFYFEGEYIQKINLMSATYNRQNAGSEIFRLKNTDGKVFWEKRFPSNKIKNDAILKLQINKEIESTDNIYILEIQGEKNNADSAATFYMTRDDAYKGNIQDSDEIASQNLYMSISGRVYTGPNFIFWGMSAGILLLIVGYASISVFGFRRGRKSILVHLLGDYEKYNFLIKQLVLRDFKTKYKRSVLGVLWSFLNPILTMTVQYIVFSTIFRSGIENFPVYLLSASVLFNFFTESVGNGLGSITGNVSLITKVSIPRYIYPVSRVLSSGINLLMSTIPLVLVVLITGTPITPAYLFIPFIYIALMIFCIGFSMFLATSMVFFRDTQFLWGVVSLLWMYATPIFYPESIIPERFSFIFKFNPMYYYLKFFRAILMDGVAPELSLAGICAFWSIIMLIVGIYVFNRNEKKFTLYI